MTAPGPRTPVLVGAAAVEQRGLPPDDAREPVRLMIHALERAAAEAGSSDLLARADSIRVPRGFWSYPDPGRLIAAEIGATAARTELAELGILQTTLLGGAARAIAQGEAEVVLIAGGEARDREREFARAGRPASYTAQPPGTAPDRLLAPADDILNATEIERGLAMPVQQYAIIENALRACDGTSIAVHRRQVAELWADFSRVAVENPHAWSRRALSPEQIAAPSRENRMIAFPYTKAHNSQWNVDQAAGLILCSLDAARRAGVPEDRWIFPLAVAESNHMVPLSERKEMAASPGFRIAAERALAAARLSIDDVDLLEIYSCFPAAVRVQQRELGIASGRPLTATGGMAFAGGPLNNYVLQALVRVVERMRSEKVATALVTAVSGMITKQGVSLWGRRPAADGFRCDDVSAEVARRVERVRLEPGYTGSARIASYTILHEGAARRAILVCDTPAGARTVAGAEVAADSALEDAELLGREVSIPTPGEAQIALD
jgi:acetyl-CoA C-acetyltransferase